MFALGLGLALVVISIVLVMLALHRQVRRDQELAERMERTATLHQRGAEVRSFRDPAAKGFQRPGGGTAA